MLELLTRPDAWIALVTLTALEIVLGIDNIVFITILAGRLPEERQLLARRLGLAVALVSRLMLLASLSWITRLTQPFLQVAGFELSGRDLILGGGGLFLLAKASFEVYDEVEAAEPLQHRRAPASRTMLSVLFQIFLLDVVFSLDSVITAVGMANDLPVMAAAVILAICFMLAFAGPVGDFVQRHPSIKLLALSFLVLIGVSLVAEATGSHLPKGYVYFAMAFSLGVEFLNMRYRARRAAYRAPSRNSLKP